MAKIRETITNFVFTLEKIGILRSMGLHTICLDLMLQSYWNKNYAKIDECQEKQMTTPEQSTSSTSSSSSESSTPISTSAESADSGIEIYTDGSGTSINLPGGWAFVVLDNGQQVCEHSGAINMASNNTAELTAAIKGLEYAKKYFNGRKITLVSDSMLVLNYAAGKWKVKAMHLTPLFISIRRLYKELEIETRWVKGHSGNPHNSRADALARKARLSLLRLDS